MFLFVRVAAPLGSPWRFSGDDGPATVSPQNTLGANNFFGDLSGAPINLPTPTGDPDVVVVFKIDGKVIKDVAPLGAGSNLPAAHARG